MYIFITKHIILLHCLVSLSQDVILFPSGLLSSRICFLNLTHMGVLILWECFLYFESLMKDRWLRIIMVPKLSIIFFLLIRRSRMLAPWGISMNICRCVWFWAGCKEYRKVDSVLLSVEEELYEFTVGHFLKKLMGFKTCITITRTI